MGFLMICFVVLALFSIFSLVILVSLYLDEKDSNINFEGYEYESKE